MWMAVDADLLGFRGAEAPLEVLASTHGYFVMKEAHDGPE